MRSGPNSLQTSWVEILKMSVGMGGMGKMTHHSVTPRRTWICHHHLRMMKSNLGYEPWSETPDQGPAMHMQFS